MHDWTSGNSPNGAIKQFTYGNGIVHTMTQNARQLPARSVDSGGILDLTYAYDSHANLTSITDATAGARQSRAMIYDGPTACARPPA